MGSERADEKEDDLLHLLTQEAIEQSRESLLGFTLYTKPDYDVNWHHRILCEYLDQFARGEIKRLIVTMPPRHGKSEQVSRRLPAYIFGRDPDAQIIAVSYGVDLASRINRDVQRIMDDPRYAEIFPDTKLFGDNVRTVAQGTYLRNSEIFEIVGRKGVYRCAGTAGGITGMGATFGIIDDPIKNQEEASSRVYREKVWEWYTSTFLTRLEKDAGVLLTVTRWNEDDIAGRLIRLAKADPEADQWVILNIPAIRDDMADGQDPRELGEALWPNKYPLKQLLKMKASMGSRVFSALYQQRPTAQEGGIIKRDWFPHYAALPVHIKRLVAYWDPTVTGTKSFAVGQVWAIDGARRYIVDQVRGRWGFTESKRQIQMQLEKWPGIQEVVIEAKANGPALIESLKDDIDGIRGFNPDPFGSKEQRLESTSPLWESGQVMSPDPHLNPWVEEWREEIVNFPNSPNSDQTDTTSMALLDMKKTGGVGSAYVVQR